MKVLQLDVTTNASGAGTATGQVGSVVPQSNVPYGGYVNVAHASHLYAVEWNPGTLGTATAFAIRALSARGAGTVTMLSVTGGTVPSVYYPRTPEHDYGGTALSTYAMHHVEGTVQLVVTTGGSVLTGTASLWFVDL